MTAGSSSDSGHDDHDAGGGEHHHAHDVEMVGCGVLTVSSSRSLGEDESGDLIVSLVEEAGHDVVVRELVNDEYDGVQAAVGSMINRDDVDVVVTNGGTGVSRDDVTVDAVKPLLEKTLPGFGELFRSRSVEEIGTRVIGSRAIGGVSQQVLVFCLPGSQNAVTLGVRDIILPEVTHLVGLASRHREEPDA